MEHGEKKTHRQNSYFLCRGAFQNQESGWFSMGTMTLPCLP